MEKRKKNRPRETLKSNGSDVEKAKNEAIRYLSCRARSVFEVRQRLEKRGFSGEAIDASVERLVELGLLDDPDFARRYARDMVNLKGYGRYLVAVRLKQKGIDADLAESVIDDIFEEFSEKEVAAGLLRKKRKENRDSHREKGRLGRYLQSKGYPWDVIRDVIREIDEGK